MRGATYGWRVPPVIWFTGLPGAGKTTIGTALVTELDAAGVPAVLIDGDALRDDVSADLGFDRASRLEQARRAAVLAQGVRAAGRIAVVTTISPYREGRAAARALLAPRFIEVHVDASPAVCEARDPKGLYRRARRGELRGFTGVDDPYEPPDAPEVHLVTEGEDPERSVARVLAVALGATGRG